MPRIFRTLFLVLFLGPNERELAPAAGHGLCHEQGGPHFTTSTASPPPHATSNPPLPTPLPILFQVDYALRICGDSLEVALTFLLEQQHDWQPPHTDGSAPAPPSNLPPGWSSHLDAASGQLYYHYALTGQVQWQPPPSPTALPPSPPPPSPPATAPGSASALVARDRPMWSRDPSLMPTPPAYFTSTPASSHDALLVLQQYVSPFPLFIFVTLCPLPSLYFCNTLSGTRCAPAQATTSLESQSSATRT